MIVYLSGEIADRRWIRWLIRRKRKGEMSKIGILTTYYTFRNKKVLDERWEQFDTGEYYGNRFSRRAAGESSERDAGSIDQEDS